jgi:hypothetical protein
MAILGPSVHLVALTNFVASILPAFYSEGFKKTWCRLRVHGMCPYNHKERILRGQTAVQAHSLTSRLTLEGFGLDISIMCLQDQNL